MVTILNVAGDVGLEVVADVETLNVDADAEVEAELEDARVHAVLVEPLGLNLLIAVGILGATIEVELEVGAEERQRRKFILQSIYVIKKNIKNIVNMPR